MNAADWNFISGGYYEQIISPIKDSVKNPLFSDIENVADKKKTVLDLGCGIGELMPLLSEKFKDVVGIDFSEEMIQKAKEKSKKLKNVKLRCLDMKKLEDLGKKFDVIISVNSILSPKIKDVNLILQKILESLKPGGVFLGVLPSMESYIYQAMLVIDEKLEKGYSEGRAKNNAKKDLSDEEFDFVKGGLKFDGDSQKTFYRFEIKYRFFKAGFREIVIDKVLYSWDAWKEAGQKSFPLESEPWDWYLKCIKPEEELF